MSLTKTTALHSIQVVPQPMLNTRDLISVIFIDTYTEEGEEPFTKTRVVNIPEYQDDGNKTDLEGYDERILTIARAIWP